jgi:hypothetical protein
LEIIDLTKIGQSVTIDFYRNKDQYQAISTVTAEEFLIVIDVN